MSTVLTDDQVAQSLHTLPAWAGDSRAVTRTVEAADFLTGIRIVDEVAVVADALDHHPDIDIRWRKVTFTLTTHSAKGVTERDLDLAQRIDEIVDKYSTH
jgi:4a-hydroxytetrahydrobiopterin dehydratase